MDIPVICYGCGATGTVKRVTAGLRCRCGSNDLDINDNAKTAEYHDYEGARDYMESQGKQATHSDWFNSGWSHAHSGETDPERPGNREYMTGFHAGTVDRRNKVTGAVQGPGTGWASTHPDLQQGWNEYVGPPVGRNPNGVRDTDDTQMICPACGGTGRDTRASGGGYDENSCRLCGGTGKYNPPTSQPRVEQNDAHAGPPVGGARWQTAHQGSVLEVEIDGKKYEARLVEAGRPSSDPLGSAEDYITRSTPGYGGRDESEKHWDQSKHVKNRPDKDYSHGDAPLQLDQATCPNCRHVPTQIVKDHKDDAWWHCPNCGPLANVDRNPDVNPYDPPIGFTADRSMKRKAGLFSKKEKTGRLFTMVAAILDNNAVTTQEALTLARHALIAYPEGDK